MQQQGYANTHRVAFYGHDQWDVGLDQTAQEFDRWRHVAIAHIGQLRDVVAGTEMLARAGQNQGTIFLVLIGLVDDVGQLFVHGASQGIASFRAVQNDFQPMACVMSPYHGVLLFRRRGRPAVLPWLPGIRDANGPRCRQ